MRKWSTACFRHGSPLVRNAPHYLGSYSRAIVSTWFLSDDPALILDRDIAGLQDLPEQKPSQTKWPGGEVLQWHIKSHAPNNTSARSAHRDTGQQPESGLQVQKDQTARGFERRRKSKTKRAIHRF
ncbi:unnamed protein product [Cladocopium goreaui]|uniref:Uncharacterized protein n=1 Tax=Cladocopium goreaui TaxID=2562237 RepID=A0A9P1DEG7_9DINO|nr:unnamed protein product [Cladocopium goreaui]